MAGFHVVIPARFASQRLPGKPLREIAKRPMLEHVYRRASESGAETIVVATDDQRIREVVESFGGEVCMTAESHQSGTDRIAEVACKRAWPDDTLVVNLQGDEPMMPPRLLQEVADTLRSHADSDLATLAVPLSGADEVFDPNVVKVVIDRQGYALYFSRAPIPWQRDVFAYGSEPSA
jgi:3-deoxy-manno-octulosonate cytidylyltransferase (CMP-KDO synthetase)